MRKKLFDYLPPILRQVVNFEHITEAEQPEFEKLDTAVQSVLNNQYYADAEERGVRRYEKILQIVPKATDTLDDRRFRIQARFNESLPYTCRSIKMMLTALCGEDGYDLELRHNDYALVVRVALTAKSMFEDVKDMLERVVPANMTIILLLKYNQQDTLARYTHDQLQNYTHKQLRSEVL